MLKKGLFLFVFACLSLPFVQQAVPFYESEPLFGFFTVAGDTSFTWQGWFSGAYQQQKEAYLNDHTGFRPDIIRAKNQLDLTLFEKFNSGNAIAGKDHYLFWENYFDSYNGKDFIGDSHIRAQMIQLSALQDTFARLNKSLILVHCPNKAFYCHEYIPDRFNHPLGHTNYESYKRIGDSLGINTIDFNAWFLSMKDTTKELLFCRQGIHWTTYGSILAGDSLVRYIEQLRHITIPHATWVRTEHVFGARDPDADIARTLNLIFPYAKERFCYPLLKYPADTTSKKPKVIFIGDSFGQNLVKNELPQHSFSDWQYWYYFKCIIDKNTWGWVNGNNVLVKDINWIKTIDSIDCIILLYTSVNLTRQDNELGSGFIEAAHAHYFPGN